MRPFTYERIGSVKEAVQAQMSAGTAARGAATVHAPGQYLAGGTTLIDLMKLDVMRPQSVTDINALDQSPSGHIIYDTKGLRLGALVRMSAAADNADIRKNYPVIAQSLDLAASAQIRNMRRSAATSFSARAALTFATQATRPATNASRAPVAPPCKASIGGTPSLAPANVASRPTLVISHKR